VWRTLRDLADELPAAQQTVAGATAALAAALEQVSQRAWTIADDCRARLASVPIPIRPLQNQLARLDHLRLLDALVDCARGSRAELLDEIERLRSEVDRARATRDRIATGAREAMERGHLTTALYDMARAVDRYDAPASDLEEARKRKDAVEAAMRENHRLAARYAELEDDPTSDAEQRVEVLQRRRELLDFLCANVAAERAVTYAQDRLDVDVRILQERAAAAERRLDTLTEPGARLALSAATLAALDEFTAAHGSERDRLGRVQRMREHWQSLHARAGEDVARAEAASAEARRRRQRTLLARGLVGTLVVALAVTAWLALRRGGEDPLAAAVASVTGQLREPLTQAGYDPVQAVLDLDRFAGDLERSGLADSQVPGGREIVRAARAFAEHASATTRGHVAWGEFVAATEARRAEFERACALLPTAAASPEFAAVLDRFARAAELTAVFAAARACSDDAQRAIVRDYARSRGIAVEVQ